MPVGGGERRKMVLIGEAWHRIVRLRLEPGGDKPLLRYEAEHGQGISSPLRRDVCGARQLMDERGDEDGLAGA